MQQSAPGLLPLLRSRTELVLLGRLFTGPLRSWQIGDLARSTGLVQSTVSREIANLERAQVVVVERVGRSKLVAANWELPWAEQLARLLDRTIGPAMRLGEALSSVPGIDQAMIFGSWAERYVGEAGPPPRDIDVLVVGTEVDGLEVQVRLDRIADWSGIEINPVFVTPDEWVSASPDSLVDVIKRRPTVPLSLETHG